jgi:hypothetical protein
LKPAVAQFIKNNRITLCRYGGAWNQFDRIVDFQYAEAVDGAQDGIRLQLMSFTLFPGLYGLGYNLFFLSAQANSSRQTSKSSGLGMMVNVISLLIIVK